MLTEFIFHLRINICSKGYSKDFAEVHKVMKMGIDEQTTGAQLTKPSLKGR